MKPYVRFNHVGQRYGLAKSQSIQALSNVQFDIERQQFVAVVGPSGCGKSTLLRLLSGLIQPTEGSVEIFGNPVTEPQDEVGIVFQKPTLLPWLSILDNVLFPLKHKHGRVTPKEREKAKELLQIVGLKDFEKQKPNELSGGMQQRVGIARALLLSPDILIMDEPFSALDALSREQMGFELLDICRHTNKTTLFITHSISEAVLLADRVLVMSPRPGTIVDDIQIDLPKPRNAQTIHSTQFSAYTKRIRDHICQPKTLSVAV
jgi:NitT/TauT family transport system ATP-binding protein